MKVRFLKPLLEALNFVKNSEMNFGLEVRQNFQQLLNHPKIYFLNILKVTFTAFDNYMSKVY